MLIHAALILGIRKKYYLKTKVVMYFATVSDNSSLLIFLKKKFIYIFKNMKSTKLKRKIKKQL